MKVGEMLLIGMAALGLALKVAPKVAAIDDTIIYGHRPPADEPFIAPPIQDVIQDMDADVSDLTIEEELEQREKDAEEALAEEGGYDPGEFANYSDGNLEVACGLLTPSGAKRFPEACEELESRRVDQQEEEEKKEPEDKKKNNLDTKKLDKLIRRVYDQKTVTYDKYGNIIEHSEIIKDESDKKND